MNMQARDIREAECPGKVCGDVLFIRLLVQFGIGHVFVLVYKKRCCCVYLTSVPVSPCPLARHEDA